MNLPFRREKADWVRVLELMYEEQIIVDPELTTGFMSAEDASILFQSVQFYDEVEPEIEGDIEESMQVLKSTGLVVENDNSDVKLYGLTQAGLQFAHQIKTERQRRRTNIGLLILTVILVVLTGFLIGVEIFEFPTVSL